MLKLITLHESFDTDNILTAGLDKIKQHKTKTLFILRLDQDPSIS